MSTVVIEGYLYRYNSYFGWSSRYCELHSTNTIDMYMHKGIGLRVAQVEIGPSTQVEESNIREFGFRIFDKNNNSFVFLAASNMATKEAWKEALHDQLHRSRSLASEGGGAAHRSKSLSISDYKSRPVIYIKVIQAQSLLPPELDRTVDAYVRITLGSSSVRTISRKRSNDPVWGQVFSFDWERNMRFARVEVFDEGSSDSSLGVVLVPVLSFLDGDNIQQSYKLSRRSRRDAAAHGSVELEISCSGQPDESQLVWRLFRAVAADAQFALPLVRAGALLAQAGITFVGCGAAGNQAATVGGDRCGGGESEGGSAGSAGSGVSQYPGGFPLCFPPIEAEVLEDFSTRVSLVCAALGGKERVAARGCLFLTNYRLIFVTVPRLLAPTAGAGAGAGVGAGAGKRARERERERGVWAELLRHDLSAQIPVGSIVHLERRSQAAAASVSASAGAGAGGAGSGVGAAGTNNAGAGASGTASASASGVGGGGGGGSESEATLLLRTADARCFEFAFHGAGAPLGALQAGAAALLRRLAVMQSYGAGLGVEGRGDDASESEHADAAEAEGEADADAAEVEGEAEIEAEAGAGEEVVTGADPDQKMAQADEGNQHDERSTSLPDPSPASSSPSNSSSANAQAHAHARAHDNSNDIRAAFEELHLSEQLDCFESALSGEGPACARMHARLKHRALNRPGLRAWASAVHRPLLRAVLRSTALVPLPITADPREMTHDARRLLQAVRGQSASASASAGGASAGAAASTSASASTEPVQGLGLGWSGDRDAGGADGFSEAELQRAEASLRGFERRLACTPLQARLNLRTALLAGWDVYDPYAELRRLGVPTSTSGNNGNSGNSGNNTGGGGCGWKVTDANCDFSLCASYPAVLAVPAGADLAMLRGSADFRSMGRLPVLSWRHPRTGVTLCRSAQPLPGLSQLRSAADENLLALINRSSGNSNGSNSKSSSSSSSSGGCDRPFVIIDARPLLNATANQAVGKGYENTRAGQGYDGCRIEFMDIDNIHAARRAFELMADASTQDRGGVKWHAQVEASGWLRQVRRIMVAAARIAHTLALQEQSVLVHCSDGWDRTAQLTSLSSLLLDPYYRTISGFIVLVEKEWLSFGHRFADRSLAATPEGFSDEKERSYVFPLWLDCVHQVLIQHAQAFEFSEALLVLLLRHLTSGWFGNFLFNSEQERARLDLKADHVSIWTVVLSDRVAFTNPSYSPSLGLVLPAASRQRLVVWDELFSPWADRVTTSAWLQSALPELGKHQDWGWDWVWGEGHSQGESKSRGQELEQHQHQQQQQHQHQHQQAQHRGSGSGGSGGGRGGVVWMDDKLVAACSNCHAKFNFIRRKHHCRLCGRVYCESCCSEQRLLEAYSAHTTQRCCQPCARTLDAGLVDAAAAATTTADSDSALPN